MPSESLIAQFAACAVMPVVRIEDARHAVPLAAALLAGGVDVVEITLRTKAALAAIAGMRAALPEMRVGAGTIVEPGQFAAARAAGAAFAVSPGATAQLIAAAAQLGMPYCPAAATPSEALTLREQGFRLLKFYPAALAGGTAALAALGEVLPDLHFMPTGGIRADTAAGYLALRNVACVGGSWIAPPELIAAENWGEITARAEAARRLREAV